MLFALHRKPILSAIAAAAALAACGGDDSPAQGPAVPASVTVSGVVADGPLGGATACYDLNDNAVCDAGEPGAVSDADGNFSFDIDAAVAGQHGMVVEVPATAIDKDTGAAVGTAFTLKSPPTGASGAQDVFVSPLSTLVVDVAASQGLATSEAAAVVQSQLGLSASPLANYVGSDAQAATLAHTVNAVIISVTQLAAGAGADDAATKALVASVSTGNLSTLAELAKAAPGGTPATVAAAVVADVLAERNLSADTAAQQAEAAKQLAGASALPAATPGPFFSARRFTYTDANNHQLQAFVGDSTPGADGSYPASEVRMNQLNGVAQPFNRNTAYWNKTRQAWEVCDNAWELVRTTAAKPATATTPAVPQVSTFCAASISRSNIVETDVGGRLIAEVVAQVRASSLRDVPGFDTDGSGLPTLWGPNPTLLGNAIFPAGARLSLREQTSEVGDTERYSLTDKPRVLPNFRHAATLADLKRMTGDLLTAGTVVSNTNAIFLDDLPAAPSDASLSKIKRYRAAFDPGSDAVRFYACDVLASNNTSLNCVTLGDGSSRIDVQADARVLRFANGYPAALTLSLKRQRQFVERTGVVFGGNRDLERKHFQQRLNTVGWNALRTALGMAEPPAPVAPAGPGPFTTLRSFAFADANNFSARLFTGDDSVLDANGFFNVRDERINVSGGVEVPFAFNRLFWNGTQWFDCSAGGQINFPARATAPFDSLYCGTYADERVNRVNVTLDGRRMADVAQDIRWYPSKDGSFDYANWGPNPAALGNATFPAGSTMTIQASLRKATPLAIATAAGDQVRVPPADASVPFNTWPFAASLDEFVAKYPGDLDGAALNGATAFYVHGYDLPAAPAPEYNTRVEIRVALSASGNRARFYQNNRAVATGFTTNYTRLLDTTYSVQEVGGVRLLQFAAMPDNFERDFAFQRLYAQRNGAVWYAYKDSVPGTPYHSIRLNGAATDAMAKALGID